MQSQLEQCLHAMAQSAQLSTLTGSRIGLEKESLRVAVCGSIAQTPHPIALGSALTHPCITTDFSEALTEMITPPCAAIDAALSYLAEIQKFVTLHINDELMWASSMPCVVEGGDSIPVANYGRSNIGTMKTIYRRGLGYRYGRTMQVIAGIHFNYSYSDNFWRMYQQIEADKQTLQAFKSERYMGLVRNELRLGWIIPYLFGASPAVCKSFLHGKPTMLSSFSKGTAFEEHATSLRMGNIGYTNSKESSAGIKASYDSLDDYVQSLNCAIRTPNAGYETIGVKAEGEYRQLSANILQIENEYYSTVRPKQTPHSGEMPIHALSERGIEYIELRSLDINPFEPLGICSNQMHFLEVFMLYSLLSPSAKLSAAEVDAIDINLIKVAHKGRDPYAEIYRGEEPVGIREWADELCADMLRVAELLDKAHNCKRYSDALHEQRKAITDASLTPSARVLREMRQHGEEYFHFAKRKALQHQAHFNAMIINTERVAYYEELARVSLQEQQRIEAADDISFDDYLRRYFAQQITRRDAVTP